MIILCVILAYWFFPMDKSSRALLTVQSIANSHLISVFIWQGEKCDGAFEWSPGISTILHRFLLTAYHLL